MRFHYYGQPQDVAGYGYYGEAPQFPGYSGYGYYAEAPQYPGYAGYGYAQPAEVGGYGYYGEADPVGYYAEESPVGYYGEDPNTTGEYQTAGYGYGQPEMVGYGEGYGDGYADGDTFAEEQPGVAEYADDYSEYGDYAEYGEPGVDGYVRSAPPAFNAGCPLPLNTGLAGYSRPGDVSPSCTGFNEQAGSPSMVPETLRPLW